MSSREGLRASSGAPTEALIIDEVGELEADTGTEPLVITPPPGVPPAMTDDCGDPLGDWLPTPPSANIDALAPTSRPPLPVDVTDEPPDGGMIVESGVVVDGCCEE